MHGPDPGAPAPDEYAEYAVKYVSLVPAGPIVPTLEFQARVTFDLLKGLSDAEALSRQPPYTWSFKEVLGHVIDAERVFSYRALRFARADPTALPGFEENDYVRAAHFDARALNDLLAEFRALREATVWLFRGLDAESWLRRGTANGSPTSVRGLAYIIAGHELHHATILRARLKTLRGA
jgi:hypothetical protein